MNRGLLVCIIGLPAYLVTAWGGAVQADEVKRFEGRVGVGVMVISSGNNLNPRGSKKYIDNLNSAAGRELTVLPLVIPVLSYDVGEPEGVKLYFESEPPIDEVGSFAFNLGATVPWQDVGTVDIGAFFTPFEEVWENPYAVGVARETSSTSRYGLKLALNRIMGTGLRLNVVYLNDDVDEDEIGQIEPDLARDGDVYAINANYSFYLSETLELRPRLTVKQGEYDGDSNSFVKYKVDFEAHYRVGRLMLIPRISYSFAEYDKINPIFAKDREDQGYGVSLLVNYLAPFGWRDWSVQLLTGYSRGDSTIDFYDTEAFNTGLFLSYHW